MTPAKGRKDGDMTSAKAKQRVFKAAMKFAHIWISEPGRLNMYRGNRGLLVKLLRACAAAAKQKKGRGR